MPVLYILQRLIAMLTLRCRPRIPKERGLVFFDEFWKTPDILRMRLLPMVRRGWNLVKRTARTVYTPIWLDRPAASRGKYVLSVLEDPQVYLLVTVITSIFTGL